MQELLSILRRLRAPDGCPWDREQTHESLRPYLLEEAAEAVDAICEGDMALADELGDVLLQVAFHAVIAEEAGTFKYDDIEQAIVDKLVRRHPHVFAGLKVSSSQEVTANWEAIKIAERNGSQPRNVAQRVPSALGALAREAQAQQLLNHSFSDRSAVIALAIKVPTTPEGLAQLLSAIVAWARSKNINPEIALRDHTNAAMRAFVDSEANRPAEQF